MRELIDVNFIDKTNYAERTSGDVGGIVLSHHWGPEGRLNRLTFQEFLQYYPISSKRMSDSWINAYRAFQSGLGSIDVYRALGTGDTYKYVAIPTSTPSSSDIASTTTASLKTLNVPAIALRYEIGRAHV